MADEEITNNTDAGEVTENQSPVETQNNTTETTAESNDSSGADAQASESVNATDQTHSAAETAPAETETTAAASENTDAAATENVNAGTTATETNATEDAPTASEQPSSAGEAEGSTKATAAATGEPAIVLRRDTVRKPIKPIEPIAPVPAIETAKPTQSTAPAPASSRSSRRNDEADDAQNGEMDFGAMLEQFEQEQARFREGDLVEGKVISVSERGVMVDFGFKAEGVINQAEFMRDGEVTVKVGDTVEAIIKRLDSGDGTAELSYFEAITRRSWDELEKAFNEETTVTGRVVDRIKGGLNVDINGVEAFLPGSLIDSRPPRNLDVFRGKDIEARVIKFNRKRANVVLSRKVLVDAINDVEKAKTFEQLGEGYVVEGKVKTLTEYGAFVDLGGIDGLLHVTDMSWSKLEKPSDLFRINDEVQVKVLKFDRERERVSLGMKQLLPDPWASIAERLEINSIIKGKVSSVTDYGAFVELEPGVEGLVHVSEMSWSKRAKHPNKIVKPGDEVEVQVLRVDTRDRRVSLGMKQALTNPWETIYERFKVGDRVAGRVRNLTEFGAFVEIEEGVDGLVHVSDITHSKKIKHPGEALKKNQEVEAVITNIDVGGRRMSLSIKDLQPSAWEAFAATHKPGDVVKGKISRFANFGVFVELADELEGLCHVSELSEERIEKPEKVFEIGQELDFKILRIERDVQKIGLSARAVGKEDDSSVDTKSYSSEAKSGMASLGELSNLRSMMSGTEEK